MHSRKNFGFKLPRLLLGILTALYIVLVLNDTFWVNAGLAFETQPNALFALKFALFGLTLLMIQLLSLGRFAKIWMSFLVLFAAASAYYLDTLNIYMDREMVQNVLSTTFAEGKHLITVSYVTQLLLTGVLPVIVITLFPVKKAPSFGRATLNWVGSVVLAFAIFAVPTAAYFKNFASTMRANRQVMAAYQPGSGLAGIVNYSKQLLRTQQAEKNLTPIGTDATKAQWHSKLDKPVLMIVVAGETARAQNFGLNGYERDTTPELRKRNVLYWPNVQSCGTSTAVSLPCMFSNLPRSKYSAEKASGQENLLDVLGHAKFDVQWWENNTGDKGIAKRHTRRNMENEPDPAYCASGECTDGIFLPALDNLIQNMTQDTVLVLHQIGSHGPAYYLRTDAQRSPYQPICEDSDFNKCSQLQIINAYDNTIVYTDWVVAQMIDAVNNANHITGAVLYVSDHGESLGENGVYLHGAPYFIAPDTQTRVPMALWMKPDLQTASNVDTACLTAKSGISHDNLFHSVLGLLDIQTIARDPKLDLFSDCRRLDRIM